MKVVVRMLRQEIARSATAYLARFADPRLHVVRSFVVYNSTKYS